MERQKILAVTPVRANGKPRRSHGQMGFSDMAKHVASQWKALHPEDKLYFEGLAADDKWRYNAEMADWKNLAAQRMAAQAAAQAQVNAQVQVLQAEMVEAAAAIATAATATTTIYYSPTSTPSMPMPILTFEDDDDVAEDDFNPTPIFEPATHNSYAHPNTLLPPPHDEAQARDCLRQFQQRTISTTTSRMMTTTPSVSSSSSSSSSDSVSNDDDQEQYLNRLANNLDQDCINLLVNMFGGGSGSSAQHKRPIPSQ